MNEGLDFRLDDEFSEVMREYEETFKNGFPTIPLLTMHGENWCIEVAKKCIAENKDVYELGYLDVPSVDIQI